MTGPVAPRRRREIFRRLIAALLLVVFAVTAAGVPLPVMKGPTQRGEPFPCADRGCGCDSADRCWRSCCCHTLSQRLAWARKHGVRPPRFAIAEAKRNGLDVQRLADIGQRPAKPSRTCCSRRATPTPSGGCASQATAHRTAAAAKSCCATRPSPTASQESGRRVVVLRALSCQGQSIEWLAAVPSLIKVPLDDSYELPLVAWLGPPLSEIAMGVAESPAPPPPKRA